jgi:RNA polymerase sigma factor (sigma-70 family)
MISRIASCGLRWDLAIAESVGANQRYVLSAMGRHGEGLVTMLWRILGNEQDVCDAYQETFLQLAHYDGRRKPDNVRAYMFRTATNIAISMLRRKEVQNKFNRSMAAHGNEKKGEVDTQELDVQHMQKTLREHIMRLPEYLRDVVMLRDLGELSYSQVGTILGIPAGTARVYRHKAVQLLAVWLSEKKNDE